MCLRLDSNSNHQVPITLAGKQVNTGTEAIILDSDVVPDHRRYFFRIANRSVRQVHQPII